MVDALQAFTPSHLSGMLGTILISWLMWPVICGIVGAQRGMAMRGAMQGLFWGPIGLPIVLLTKQKHRCPTCGQRTLSAPVERPPPHAVVLPATGQKHDDAPPIAHRAPSPTFRPKPPPIADASIGKPMSQAQRQRIIEEACAGYSEEEAARLLAWVNGA